MSLTLIAPPAEEPVTVAALRQHMRLDDAVDDGVVAALGVAARAAIEARFGLAILAQGWRLALDAPPVRPITLPLSPILSVDAVGAVRGGVVEALPPEAYEVETGRIGRVRIKGPAATDRALGGLVIAFTAGFADAAAAPEDLKLAIKVLAADIFEHPEGAWAERFAAGDGSAAALAAPWRQVRL
jgi:uncharacterized phiE125 gp8 family phage protein